MKPLTGLRLLDLSRLLPGPLATMLLADLGAEVIKVESPHPGDYLRHVPPQAAGSYAGFASLNRNKRSLVVDMDTSEGVEILRRLAGSSDILLESFRGGHLDRRGLGWADLREVNPGLIYGSLSGYGQSPGFQGRAGHDLNFLALSGLGATLRDEAGAPIVPAVQLADTAGAWMAALSLLAALHERQRSGRGRHLDLSVTDACLAFTPLRAACQLAAGTIQTPLEALVGGQTPAYRYYRCLDGRWLSVAALEEKFRRPLCQALGIEELADLLVAPPPLSDPARDRLEAIFATRTRDEWMERLGPLDVCVEPLLEPEELASHPLAEARGWVRAAHLEGGGTLAQPASAVQPGFDPEGRAAGQVAPPAGRHTREILSEAGYSSAEIERLLAEGHARQAPSP